MLKVWGFCFLSNIISFCLIEDFREILRNEKKKFIANSSAPTSRSTSPSSQPGRIITPIIPPSSPNPQISIASSAPLALLSQDLPSSLNSSSTNQIIQHLNHQIKGFFFFSFSNFSFLENNYKLKSIQDSLNKLKKTQNEEIERAKEIKDGFK